MFGKTVNARIQSQAITISRSACLFSLFCSMLLASYATAIGQTVRLTAYNSDGTNTGTARLGRYVSIVPTVQGATNTSVTWSLVGVGALSGSGLYTAPISTLPNATATVTATLDSNNAISTSYQMALINPIPALYGMQSTQFVAGATGSETVIGSGFVAGTVIVSGGAPVPTTYQSPTVVRAQISVANSAQGSVAVYAVNPTPGGGNSTVLQVPIASATIQLTAYDSDGSNTATARLGRNVSISATVQGSANVAVLWSLTGPGTVSSSGLYTAPTSTIPNATATVTATLVANPSISAAYRMTLINPAPAFYGIKPAQLLTGGTNSVTVSGSGFIVGTTILSAGTAVPTTYQSPTVVTAQIPVDNSAKGTLAMSAWNPSPGGGASSSVQVPIASGTIQLTAYNSDGTNTASARLGRNVSILANVQGSVSTQVAWSVAGSGTVSSSGLYTAPSNAICNTVATVTATLVSNPAIYTSYKMTLINPVPTISTLTPWQLTTAIVNSVAITGNGFVPGTIVLVNGSAISATFQSPTSLVAQIPVSTLVQGSMSLVAQNPAPGGGTSIAYSAPITPLTILLTSLDKRGITPNAATLGHSVQFLASVHGSGDPTINWVVNWSVQGVGAISSSGVYQAPVTVPLNANIVVAATLAANPSVTSTYPLLLLNPAPVINATNPTQVKTGITNAVTISGGGFNSATIIRVNGTPVSAAYQSDSVMLAQIPVSASTPGPLQLTGQNPTPGGGISSPFSLLICTPSTATAQIGNTPGLIVPLDYLGLSHEWGDAEWFMGTSQTGVNAVYRQLVQNLINPGSSLLVRVGGVTTDASGEPSSGTTQALVELAKALPVQLTLGLNLGSNNPQLARDQAQFFESRIPVQSIAALEIGNEPDNYASNGQRSSTYSVANYVTDFASWTSTILPALPNAKFMGPSVGSLGLMLTYISALERTQSANIALISHHFYAGHQSGGIVFAPNYLLTPAASTQGPAAAASTVNFVHGLGQQFRIGEMNSIDGGGVAGISNAFGSALWAIDTLFEFAKVGVDGVNIHGTSGCNYCAFTFGVTNTGGVNHFTLQYVSPLYYGLMFFHAATANHAALLPVTVQSQANIKVWATLDQNGIEHIAILNKDESFAGTVALTVSGYGSAQVQRLVAPSYESTAGISFDGQTFDGSIDGTQLLSLATEAIQPSNGVYSVSIQPTSAVLLTLTH